MSFFVENNYIITNMYMYDTFMLLWNEMDMLMHQQI